MARHQPHLLVDLAVDSRITVDRDTRHHMEKVLRFASGAVSYTDGAGVIGTGVYDSGVIRRGDETTVTRPRSVTVAVAPPDNTARARFLVEKLAELEIEQLVWLRTNRGEGRIPRLEKVEAWIRGAIEQSRGAWLMRVDGPTPVIDVGSLGTVVFADPNGAPISTLTPMIDPVWCVGPEGGFDPGEIPPDAARVTLGATVLRVETAAIAGAVLLREHPE